MTRAVVFAYHDVGVRCLRVLLAHGVDVSLVVSQEDQAGEQIWFDSVARHARWHGLPLILPAEANSPAVIEQVRAARPDFLFSFYYRQMLGEELLQVAPRGANKKHGSLLPKYRGRVPINWAVLNGETETGATLHAMTAKPDAGGIVGRQAVPVLPDDTAGEVFRKVTVAAELLLNRCLPGLLAGTARLEAQDLTKGSYFGRRTARDGAIDWQRGMLAVHNLVRAVAPPYPGAYALAGTHPLRVLRTLPLPGPGAAQPVLCWRSGEVLALCHDGALKVLAMELNGEAMDAEQFFERFGTAALPLASAAA